jgi:hypothetical protein
MSGVNEFRTMLLAKPSSKALDGDDDLRTL